MTFRNTIKLLTAAFTLFHRLVLCVVVTVLAGGIVIIGKNYLEIPSVLLDIKDKMLHDRSFVSKVGEYNGYSIWFDKELAAKKSQVPFSVSINGKRGVYVKITGYYTVRRDGGIECVKNDTLFSE